MYRLEHKQTKHSTNRYATGADFCQAFKENLKQLYVLGFLLTASRRAAEECVLSALEIVSSNNHVFTEFVPSWVRRAVINAAVRSVFERPAMGDPLRDSWWGEQNEAEVGAIIDAITRLAPLDRFVYVLCILEGCSSKECSLLLGRSVDAVVCARLDAFNALHRHKSVRQERSHSNGSRLGAMA